MSIDITIGLGQTGTCTVSLYEDLHGSYPSPSPVNVRVVRVIRCEFANNHAGKTHQRTMQDGVVVAWTV